MAIITTINSIGIGVINFFLNFSFIKRFTQNNTIIDIIDTIRVPIFVLCICLPMPITFFYYFLINKKIIIK